MNKLRLVYSYKSSTDRICKYSVHVRAVTTNFVYTSLIVKTGYKIILCPQAKLKKTFVHNYYITKCYHVAISVGKSVITYSTNNASLMEA